MPDNEGFTKEKEALPETPDSAAEFTPPTQALPRVCHYPMQPTYNPPC